MARSDPANTEYIVIRYAHDGESDNSDAALPFEGEWRKRSDLDDQSVVEIALVDQTLRAYPTDEIELSGAGEPAQVYEVPVGSPDGGPE